MRESQGGGEPENSAIEVFYLSINVENGIRKLNIIQIVPERSICVCSLEAPS